MKNIDVYKEISMEKISFNTRIEEKTYYFQSRRIERRRRRRKRKISSICLFLERNDRIMDEK